MAIDSERERYEAMIEEACQRYGLTIDDWSLVDGRPRAELGKWVPQEDTPTAEHFDTDEGLLSATVVGGREYANERVCFVFTTDYMDEDEVDPLDLEPA